MTTQSSMFRFSRHGCGPAAIDITVYLTAQPSNAFSVTVDPKIPASSKVDAVLRGIRSARDAAAPDAMLAVTVTLVDDRVHATGELGYKICGEAAMYCLLGLPERAPFPGIVLERN